MENFVLPIFAAIRRNWAKNGQKQDGIRTGKNARKRDSRTRLLSRRDCKKCRETFSPTPAHRMEGMETAIDLGQIGGGHRVVGGGPAGLAVVVLTIRHQRDLAAAADGAAIHFRNQCHIQTTPFSYCLYFTTGNAICKTHHFHLKHESFQERIIQPTSSPKA